MNKKNSGIVCRNTECDNVLICQCATAIKYIGPGTTQVIFKIITFSSSINIAILTFVQFKLL